MTPQYPDDAFISIWLQFKDDLSESFLFLFPFQFALGKRDERGNSSGYPLLGCFLLYIENEVLNEVLNK